MNNAALPAPNLSFIVNAHREELLLMPALRSVIAAAVFCRNINISCEIIVIGDKVDPATRSVISRFDQQIDVIEYVEYGNLGSARQHAIMRAKGEYYCFLDGDDIWQEKWPALAYQHAQRTDNRNCIYHTELFAGFGVDSSFVRAQLRSDDPIFHPLHLATSWHFCNNLFAHSSIFTRVPITPYDHSKGFGSEDWHWSCETLAQGIERDLVPGTVYFYRRDPARPTLGTIAGLVLQPTALFRDPAIIDSYADFAGLDDRCDAQLLHIKNRIRYADELPAWLYAEAKAATRYDNDIFELLRVASDLKCETPDINVGASYLFGRAAAFCGGNYSIVAIDCENMTSDRAGHLQLGLRRAARDGHRLLVLCGDALTAQQLVRQEGDVCYFNYKMVLRECGDIAYLLDQALGNFLSNYRPAAIINVNSEYVDYFCGARRQFLGHQDIPSVRYMLAPLHDIQAAFWDRRLMADLNQTKFSYTYLAVTDLDSFKYASAMYSVSGTEILMVPAKLSYIELLISHVRSAQRKPSPSTPDKLTLAADYDNQTVDVSCILNLHREGAIVMPTFTSIARMMEFAQHQGLHCELVIVLDNADGETRRLTAEAQKNFFSALPVTIIEVSNGDLGSSRRNGIDRSTGTYIALLDGDDLYSENWIAEAFSHARSEAPGKAAIYHPEVNIYFGAHHRAFRHPDPATLDPSGIAGLLLENYWTSLSFGHRSIYLENPVHDNGIDDGHGYEDWHWNMDTVAKGIKHRPVPRTAHFVRLKPTGSLNLRSASGSAIVRPSSFARQLIFGRSKSKAVGVSSVHN
ncbi:glycosyltransferase family 2 protein [Pseudoduganella lutea]|uniref:Glycosyltransferase n=1 Tax=Pseudoduganella lutea TaxID=321985 RepID=A0A4P6KZV1_9BURK|nr:glycosyltransferase family A protein [Pseudoduganella lutea]QBE64811.1 glycosyltransferase [Pseudoduganella lutea]